MSALTHASFSYRFVLSDGRNTAEQGRTKAEQGGTKPNMAEQAEQGKTKAELFRPLCAQGPYPPDSRWQRRGALRHGSA